MRRVRLLRRWLLFPLVDVARIRRRQDAVERLFGAHAARDAARKVLGEIGDLERLVGRARLGVASPRDLVSLGAGLQRLPELAEALQSAAAGEIAGGASSLASPAPSAFASSPQSLPPPRSPSPSATPSASPSQSSSPSASQPDVGASRVWPAHSDDLADLGNDLAEDVARRIAETLRSDVPGTTKEGGFVRPGLSA